MPRSLPLRRALIVCRALAPLFVVAGCATTAPPAAGVPPAKDASGRAIDPVCGERYRWEGTRCAEIEEVATTSASLGAPTSAPGRPTNGEGAAPPGGAAASRRPVDDDPLAAPTPKQLVIKDVSVGDGKKAITGDVVRVHYVGKLTNGTEFDSSRKRGEPLEFRLGTGQVIKGFDRAVEGMKVGGIRRVIIPPDLGYGRKGAPPTIPPNATLDFELELVEVVTPASD